MSNPSGSPHSAAWPRRRCVTASLAAVLVIGLGSAPAHAASNVKAGRSYVGTVASSNSNSFGGGPLRFSVSADGKTAAAVAVYHNCAVGGLGNNEVPFPSAAIVHGTFKTTFRQPRERPGHYATITIRASFLSGGRASGTISGATNINSVTGAIGPVCATSNTWSAKAKPAGFGVCEPRPLGSHATAQDITDEHTSCVVVDKALAKGKYNAPPVGNAQFSTPGWTCQVVAHSGAGEFNCTRHDASFHFAVS